MQKVLLKKLEHLSVNLAAETIEVDVKENVVASLLEGFRPVIYPFSYFLS